MGEIPTRSMANALVEGGGISSRLSADVSEGSCLASQWIQYEKSAGLCGWLSLVHSRHALGALSSMNKEAS